MNQRRRKVKRVIAILMSLFIVATTAYYGNTGQALAEALGMNTDESTAEESTQETTEEQTESSDEQGEPEGDGETTDTTETEPTAAPEQTEEDPTEETAEETTEVPTEDAETTEAPEATPTEAAAPTDQTLNVAASDGSTVILSGVMPVGATATAVPVQVSIEGQDVLAAYDITIKDAEGNEYQPQDGAISVQIVSAAVQEAVNTDQEISVYHMETAEAAPQEVTNATPTAEGVKFQAESFSIYVVTAEHYTVTFKFYGTDDTSGTPINTQILSEEEELKEPQTPAATGTDADKKKFTGWKVKGTDGTLTYFDSASFGQKAGTLYGTSGKLKANQFINLVPSFSTVHYVYYQVPNGGSFKTVHTEALADGETITMSTTESYGYDPGTGKALIGWTTETSGSTTVGTNRIVQSTEGDIYLYPVVVEAHWITYETNGGSIVEPSYVLYNEKTVEPASEPEKKGYSFGGWYADQEYTQQFEFGGTLEEDLILYAKWNASQTNYTIIYWKETLTEGTYDLAGQTSATAATGSLISANDLEIPTYKYFHYDADASNNSGNSGDDGAVEIQANGSSVVNVRYARNTYTFVFNLYNYNEYSNAKLEINGESYPDGNRNYSFTAKYGEDITDKWPTADNITGTGTFGRGWDEETKNLSECFTGWSGGNTTALFSSKRWNVTDEMIKNSSNGATQMYVGNWSSDVHQVTLHYMAQNADDDNYTEITEYTQKANTTGTFLAKDIEGFTYSQTTYGEIGGTYAASYDKWGNVQYENWYKDYYFMYDRNNYTLTFYNQNDSSTKIKGPISIRYGKNIADQNWTPTAPSDKEGYTFGGWYTTPGCYGGSEYYFTTTDAEGKTVNATMPAANLSLYAKWIPKQVTVTYMPNAGTDTVTDMPATEKIDAGSTATQPSEDPTRANFTFSGWTTDEDGTIPFNFSTQLIENTILYAQWVSTGEYTLTYNANNKTDGTSATQVDEMKYSGGAKAKTISIPTGDNWAAPDASKGFLCWNTKADGTGDDIYPGNEYTMPNENAVLYTKWAEGRQTTLTYNYMGGMEKGTEKQPYTVPITTPNELTTVLGIGNVTKEGYYFAGWSTSEDGSDGILVQENDTINVDTVDPENNVLYAQWKECSTITVTKKVDGNMGNKDAYFSFSYTIKRAGESAGTGTFDLRDSTAHSDDKGTINNLRQGDVVTVTETSSGDDGYSTTATIEGEDVKLDNGTATHTVKSDGTSISMVFTNKKDVVPPTGLSDNMGAYGAMVLAGLGTAVIFFAPRRKRR